MSNVKGTKPISAKKEKGSSSFSFTPRNPLDIPEELKRELKEQGLDYRWLDAKQMASNNNMHRMHWEIYKRKATSSEDLIKNGLPADGTIRSGTCVLGVRKIDKSQAHKDFLKEKRVRQNQSLKSQVQQFREEARRGGGSSKGEIEVGSEKHYAPQADDE